MLKKLKSLFIIEEEVPPLKKKEENRRSGGMVKQESRKGQPGTVRTKFVDVLFAAIEKENLEGFDYLEFKQSLQRLSQMQMEEAVRFQSAFAVAETMGITPEELVQSAQHYLDVLSREEEKFEAALHKQKATRIQSKGHQIEHLEKTILEKEEKIKALTAEIEEHRREVDELQKEMTEATQKVATTKNDFIVSFNQLVSQLQNDIEAMKKYLM